MNEGILALLVQWCLLCLVWMGSLDKAVTRIGLTRRLALAGLVGSLVAAFAGWRLRAAAVDIDVAGALVPFFAAAHAWTLQPNKRRGYAVAAACLCASTLFLFRRMLFGDPILLVLDESVLVPIVTVTMLFLLSRDWQIHWFLLLIALPISDAFYTLSFLRQTGTGVIGAEAAQDLLWTSIALWTCAAIVWTALGKGAGILFGLLLSGVRMKSKTHSHR